MLQFYYIQCNGQLRVQKVCSLVGDTWGEPVGDRKASMKGEEISCWTGESSNKGGVRYIGGVERVIGDEVGGEVQEEFVGVRACKS